MITLVLAQLGATLLPQVPDAPRPDPASVNVYYETYTGGLRLTAQMRDAAGPGFALVASLDDDPRHAGIVASGVLDASGSGTASVLFPESLLDVLATLDEPIRFFGAYLGPNGVHYTRASDLALGFLPDCETLDFDFTIGDDSVMVPGQEITNQWSDIGLNISADNARPGGPDMAILFDSSNPTGGDTDLRTPNPSALNNTVAFGNLLIIAENAVDSSPADGLVDVPDDEAAGGSIYFDFDIPAHICSVTVVDIDDAPGTELRFYRNGNLTTPDETLPIPFLGDGSVQTLTFDEMDVDRLEVFFTGSGGIPQIEFEPCPRILSFDEDSVGRPLGLPAGTWVTDQFMDVGVTVSANNNVAGHPDKAILFDTANPTGGDFDLRTPNPSAPGNTIPLGLVLIIAENDIDVSPMDGLVDDPDDEAGGGTIRLDFAVPVTIFSMRVLDVDGMEIDFLRLFDGSGTEIYTELIPDLADGSVQFIQPNTSGVRRMELQLGGSGAVSRIRFCPDDVAPAPTAGG